MSWLRSTVASIVENIYSRFLSPQLAILPLTNSRTQVQPQNHDDGILWAVPKKRKSLERRLKAKYGSENYGYQKLIHPKKNLLVCTTCGNYHEARHLCPHCFKRIMEETKAMQDKIVEKLGLSPQDKDVIVLYKDDKHSDDEGKFGNKNVIVEMEKERPSWWSKNLLQRHSKVEDRTSTKLIGEKFTAKIKEET